MRPALRLFNHHHFGIAAFNLACDIGERRHVCDGQLIGFSIHQNFDLFNAGISRSGHHQGAHGLYTAVALFGNLGEIAAEIDIGSFIRLGEGELKTGGAKRPSILADACEAVFGAVFLDGGFESAQRVILRLYEPILAAGNVTPERFAKDAKTQLQEFLQAAHMKLPEYRVITTTGAAHNQTFRCACVIENPAVTCEGEGKSRRAAEQMAAAAVLAKLQAIKS